MALRGAAAATCVARRTRRTPKPSLVSISRHFGLDHPHRSSSFSSALLSHPDYHQTGFRYPIRLIHGATASPFAPKKEDEEKSPENWKIKMLYDGDCPLCMREVNMLRERNKEYGTIKFVDIGSDEYSPEENQGLDYETVMGRIHAILADGTIVTDVEAFRRLYEQVGLGWVYAITKYEPVGKIADAIYSVWAKYRLPITGRPPLQDILEARRKNKGEACNDNSSCKM